MSKITLALSIVIAIVGMVRFKKLTMPFKILAIYLVYIPIDIEASRIFIQKYHDNSPIVHIETLVYFTLFSLIYYFLLKNKYIKKTILISIISMALFAVVNAFYLQPYYNKIFPSYVMIPTVVLLASFSLLLFKQMLLYPVQVNIIKQSVFWYNTAILFFSTTMFLNFCLINYYSEHNINNPIVFYFWSFIEIVLNLLLGISILTDKKSTYANGV